MLMPNYLRNGRLHLCFLDRGMERKAKSSQNRREVLFLWRLGVDYNLILL